MHLLTCLVCGEKTDDGPKLDGQIRPLCGNSETPERGCYSRWWYSMERKRGWMAKKTDHEPRAFMDWLNRVRAERRNARAA